MFAINFIRRVVHHEYPSFIWKLFDLMAAVFFITNCILAELDAWSRFQSYKQLKDHLYLNGYNERLLRTMMKSMCQRQAALEAADELGMGAECRLFFNRKSYRRYHLIPDFIFENPAALVSGYFWRSTFFVPYYNPKVDFCAIEFLKHSACDSKPGLRKGSTKKTRSKI